MYLKNKRNGDLVEILDIRSLTDPGQNKIAGRYPAVTSSFLMAVLPVNK